MTSRKLGFGCLMVTAAAWIASGCHTDMWRQPKALPQQGSAFFADGRSDRPPVEGTVAVGEYKPKDLRNTGYEGGKLATRLPETLKIGGEELSTSDARGMARILRRGRDRFEVFCTPCHGQLGDGRGMIAQRGLELRRSPGNYHTDRLREMPIGHFFDVITNGYGVMYPYGYRIETDDRWAIAAYVRALQLSQHAKASELGSRDQRALDRADSGGGR